MNKKLFGVIIACGLLLGVLYRFVVTVPTSVSNTSSDLFYAENMDFGIVLEEEVVTKTMKLHNYSDKVCNVVGAFADCNCLTLKHDNVMIKPRGVCQIKVTYAPVGQFGKRSFITTFHLEQGGYQSVTNSEIVARVASGIRAYPEVVILRDCIAGESSHAIVNLFDSYPGDGTNIHKIVTSNPQLLKATKIDGFTEIVIPTQDELGFNPRSDFKHRGQLSITVNLPDQFPGKSSEWITLYTRHKETDLQPRIIPVEIFTN